jgi:pimeloyl-ACP methyl ester carboxylesterase
VGAHFVGDGREMDAARVSPAAVAAGGDAPGLLHLDVASTWTWRGMRVNYLPRGQGPPILLVHGFGAAVAHWRSHAGELALVRPPR